MGQEHYRQAPVAKVGQVPSYESRIRHHRPRLHSQIYSSGQRSYFSDRHVADCHPSVVPLSVLGIISVSSGQRKIRNIHPTQGLHFAMLEAIKKYEAATNWSVADLKFTAKQNVSDLDITVISNPPSPR